MAVVSDKDEQHKGQELWKALKKDPLDRRRIRDLIINRAPTNFREPGVEVKCVNLFSFSLFSKKKKRNSAVCSADPGICYVSLR